MESNTTSLQWVSSAPAAPVNARPPGASSLGGAAPDDCGRFASTLAGCSAPAAANAVGGDDKTSGAAREQDTAGGETEDGSLPPRGKTKPRSGAAVPPETPWSLPVSFGTAPAVPAGLLAFGGEQAAAQSLALLPTAGDVAGGIADDTGTAPVAPGIATAPGDATAVRLLAVNAELASASAAHSATSSLAIPQGLRSAGQGEAWGTDGDAEPWGAGIGAGAGGSSSSAGQSVGQSAGLAAALGIASGAHGSGAGGLGAGSGNGADADMGRGTDNGASNTTRLGHGFADAMAYGLIRGAGGGPGDSPRGNPSDALSGGLPSGSALGTGVVDGGAGSGSLGGVGSATLADSPVVPSSFWGGVTSLGASTSSAAASTGSVAVPVGSQQFAEALADEVRVLVDPAAGNGLRAATLKLNPEHLGPVEVRVLVQEQQAHIAFTAQHAAAREALEAALPRLRDTLLQQGFMQVNLDVGSRDPSLAQQGFAQGGGPQSEAERRFAAFGAQTPASETATPIRPRSTGMRTLAVGGFDGYA